MVRSAFRNLIPRNSITRNSSCTLNNVVDPNRRSIHYSVPYYASHFKARDRKELLKTVRKPDEGVDSEHVALNASISSYVFAVFSVSVVSVTYA